MHHVQMVDENYDVIHNPKAKEKYPALYRETIEHDKVSAGSWYDLTDKAYAEYLLYMEDKEIGYMR